MLPSPWLPVVKGRSGPRRNTDHAAGDVRDALLATLKDLRITYLDLYLIHWPVSEPMRAGDRDDPPLTETWAAMEKLIDEVCWVARNCIVDLDYASGHKIQACACMLRSWMLSLRASVHICCAGMWITACLLFIYMCMRRVWSRTLV